MQTRPPAFLPLGLTEIQPTGWLRRQLRIQADGLSGHLDEFWPDVQRSGWIGGDCEGWERGPYWLDGLVPLAFLLNDPALLAKIHHWMDYILTHQREDGWLGPVEPGKTSNVWDSQKRDPWPLFIFFKAAVQYHSATGDPRVVPALARCAKAMNTRFDMVPVSGWPGFRTPDWAISLVWLYEQTGDPEFLWIARRALLLGYNWIEHFRDLPYSNRTPQWSFDSHIVNHAMAVKMPAVLHRLGRLDEAESFARHVIAELDRCHGQVTGMFNGDESLAGRSPVQGVELCTVVEYLFSIEHLAAAFGSADFGDRLEQVVFNALPAGNSPDMWYHQYVQQANQVQCVEGDADSAKRVYTNNGPRANLFGLEPHFACCTANLHQGWPKFAAHLWMRAGPDALAAVAYAPCRLTTTLAGVPATLDVVTDYPFRSTIDLALSVERPTEGELLLRIPAWTAGATVAVDGQTAQAAQAGGYHRLRRRWTGRHSIRLELPMPVRLERRFNNAAAILRGPLVYSLKIGETWQALPPIPVHADKQYSYDYPDHEVRPTTPWNYALDLDDANLAASLSFTERPVGDCPFSPEGAPVVATVRGRRLPAWGLEKDAAAPPPQSPVRSNEPEEQLTLIPYGCTNLRVTEFPTLAR